MANVITRRIFTRNIFKLKEFTQFTNHSRYTSVFVINFNCKSDLQCYNIREQKYLSLVGQPQIRKFSNENKVKNGKETQLSVFQRFKQMYKDYWYVLVPVHLVTSAAWFGGFYYLAKSGVDIPALLESLKVSEKITNSLRDSSMGYLAVAYALYKVATPARYTVTLGGTTISITYLKKWGYIKPVPSTERLKEMYLEKKDNLLETMRDTKEGLKDKKDDIIDELDSSIKQIKELGEKIKSTKGDIVDQVKKKTEKKVKT